MNEEHEWAHERGKYRIAVEALDRVDLFELLDLLGPRARVCKRISRYRVAARLAAPSGIRGGT